MRFDDVITGNIGWIARVAFRFCKNKADADDLAQETIYRAYANREKYDNARDFKPWALTIMTNIVKSQHTRKRCVQFVAIEEDLEVLSTLTAESLVYCDDISGVIRRCSKLAVGVRCGLLYAAGYSYIEIAEIVGIKHGTVKSRIASGRAILKEALDGYLP